MTATSFHVAFPVEPPDDGDGVRLTLQHDGWRLELFTLHTPHRFWQWAAAGSILWGLATLAALACVPLHADPVMGLVWAMIASFAAVQLALLPLGVMLVMRVRYLELGRGRLVVAGMLGEGISIPLERLHAAWSDGEALVVVHADRGTLRLPIGAGSEILREWLAQSIDAAARRVRGAPKDPVPTALVRMTGRPIAMYTGDPA